MHSVLLLSSRNVGGLRAPKDLPCSESAKAYCAARALARPVLGGRWCASTSRQAPRAVGPVTRTSASRTRRLGGAAGTASPYVTVSRRTGAESHQLAEVDPKRVNSILCAFNLRVRCSTAIAKEARNAPLASRHARARVRRRGPCRAAWISCRSCLDGARIVRSLLGHSAPASHRPPAQTRDH